MTTAVAYNRDATVISNHIKALVPYEPYAYVVVVHDTATGDYLLTDVLEDVSPYEVAETLVGYQRELVAVVCIYCFNSGFEKLPDLQSGNAETVDAP